MTKLIGLSCTHRPTSCLTDTYLNAAIRGFSTMAPDFDVQNVRLADNHLKLCVGNDECLRTGSCPLDDDFYKIVDQCSEAKAMILSTPVYGGNIPSILKILTERLKTFMNNDERPFGDLLVCTIVHSRTMLTESALGALAPWYIRLKNKNVVSVCLTKNLLPDILASDAEEMCELAGRQLAHHVQQQQTLIPQNPLN